jgi:inorganic phosphate transporter, PiT family
MDIALLIFILLTGFYMAWNIGANDVANAMGTSVGSGALTIRRAVLIAALLEFSGAFFFGSHVSKTMQSGIIHTELFAANPYTLAYGMLAALGSAGLWLQAASYFGWPVSTTHSIVGAIIGFGLVIGGVEAVQWSEVGLIFLTWIVSPLFGGILGYIIFSILRKQIFYRPNPVLAAHRLTPVIVFIVILVLSLILIFEGFDNLKLSLSDFQKYILAFSLSLLAALISFLVIRKINLKPSSERETVNHAALVSALEKTKKQLSNAQTLAQEEMHYQIGLLSSELERLTQSARQKTEGQTSETAYLKVESIFGYLQIMSACMMAFAHGANDVANAIGPLSAAVAILTTGLYAVDAPVPTWALALGGLGIVIGLATWGWRVIETIGKKITELTPSRGFAAEFGAALTIVLASRLGMPISTTHTLVGAVLGVGFARGLEAINLNTTRDILVSWVVTVPLGAILSIILFYPIQAIFG